MQSKVLSLVLATVSVLCFPVEVRSQEVRTPAEFEPQEYVWMTWIDSGWLGGPKRTEPLLAAMREIVPQTKVRLLYDEQRVDPDLIMARLLDAGIDTESIELFHDPVVWGAIQDPGPAFVLLDENRLGVADFGFVNPKGEEMDRRIAGKLGLPVIRSDLISEGGARESNGQGTLLLVEEFERTLNPEWSPGEIEQAYERTLGATNVIWLKQGLKEEGWGRLENGIWGIGTGGHADTFVRFAGPRTILLAEVSAEDRASDPVLRESHRRVEESFEILQNATDEKGRPFEIIRVPIGPLMTRTIEYDHLSAAEQSWFDGAVPGDRIEFYPVTGYLNFIIANGVVVTARYWREGMPDALRLRDERARQALERAFRDRRIVLIDTIALNYDGAGLHCYVRNQPAGGR